MQEADEAPVREMLNTFPRARDLALRKGRPPGKGSPSEWDWALGCELARAGATDEEVRTAIMVARRTHDPKDPKARRDDYLDGTVAGVRAEVPKVHDPEAPTDAERLKLGAAIA